MFETYARKIYIIEEQYTANSRRVYPSMIPRFGFPPTHEEMSRDTLQIQRIRSVAKHSFKRTSARCMSMDRDDLSTATWSILEDTAASSIYSSFSFR